ncbi:MAG: translation elongation factor Ts, partial [Pelagibacterales bacterium]|nr:translation elongation factor Ts [Pelagibacterales bacterium]
MSSGNLLEKVKQLRKITGVGYKDCKNAIDETQGDIEKSVELLRKKGIAKAIKKMSRVAAEGLICIYEQDNQFSMIEINSETDFVAKNNQFVNFAEEISQLALIKSGKMEDILNSTMTNKKNVKDNLVDLISKIGEKITLRRSAFIGKDKSINFSYTHSSLKKNVGKLGVLLSIETTKPKNEILNLGKQLAMQVAASSPLAIDKESLDQNILQKEKEIIKEELKNSGKDTKIVEKIAIGKLNKFIADNTLLNQEWIMDPKKKVKDVLKEVAGKDKIEIK